MRGDAGPSTTAVLAGVATLPAGGEDGKLLPTTRCRPARPRPIARAIRAPPCLSTTSLTNSDTFLLPGTKGRRGDTDGIRLAVTICEDAWNDKGFWPRRLYSVDPMEELMRQNPALHVNLSSSPFWHSKRALRREMLAAIARRDGIPVLMCNQVGGDDSLIFDGSSLALNARGELIAQAASFREDLVIVDPFTTAPLADPPEDDTEAAYRALVLGTRDYVRKCGFLQNRVALSQGSSIRPWWRPSPPKPSAQKTSLVWVCPAPIRLKVPLATASASPPTSAFALKSSALARSSQVHAHARAGFRRSKTRYHRRKHSITLARRSLNGTLQQIRRTGAYYR